jgi:hypothetical protein
MSTAITFEQIKPTILVSLGLQGAKEVWSNYSTEYEVGYHPDYPKTILLWADFDPTAEGKDGINGKYISYEIKVLDYTRCKPRDDGLVYALTRVNTSKWFFDKHHGGSIDSLLDVDQETPFYRARMQQLVANNK